jgi:hypothetical protein
MLPNLPAFLCIVTVSFGGSWQSLDCGRRPSIEECREAIEATQVRPREPSAYVRMKFCTNDKPGFWED